MTSPIADTFGEALIGLVLAAVFYGVTLVQAYTYVETSSGDNIILKAFVGLVFVADTVHLGLVAHVIWHYLIDDFGQPLKVYGIVVNTLLAQIMVSTAIATLVQGFFANRVRILSGRVLLPVIIVLLALAHFGFDIYFMIFFLKSPEFIEIPRRTWVTDSSLACSVTSDVLVAIALCYYLYTSKNGIRRTDTILNRLILYAVTTGLLTTIFSLITLTLFAVSTTFISQTFYFSIAKFYTNSLLASLNSRQGMRRVLASETVNTMGRSDADRSFQLSQVKFVKSGNLTTDSVTRIDRSQDQTMWDAEDSHRKQVDSFP